MKLGLVALLLSIGCAETKTKQCGVITCGPDTVCSPNNDRCVTQTQLDACTDSGDGDGCSVPGITSGVCISGVCLGGGCGNGIEDPGSDEVCDDGNLVSGDGCRADCKSREECGDGVVDFSAGEACDCGDTAANMPFGCTEPNGDGPTAFCRPTSCALARCGDFKIDIDEVCDDGNNVPGDGCRADCQGRWTQMQSPTLATLRDVAAASASDAWAVGSQRVLHWDGSVWTSVPLPAEATDFDFTDVYVIGPDDVLVIGSGTGGSRVFRRHQGVWTNVTPTAVGTPNVTWSAFGGRGSDVYVGGNAATAWVAHFNGTQFDNAVETFISTIVASLALMPDGTLYFTNGIYTVYRRDGGAWTTPFSETGQRIVTPTATSQWLLGYDNAYHSTNASTWTQLAGASELNAPSSGHAAADIALLVGGNGEVLRCSTTACVISPTATTGQLNSVWVVDADHAFIVGDGGLILY